MGNLYFDTSPLVNTSRQRRHVGHVNIGDILLLQDFACNAFNIFILYLTTKETLWKHCSLTVC